MLEFISNEHNLFPTPLWQIQIKGVDNDAIKEYCYHLKDNTEGVTISNRGGWHSKEILEPLPDALNELFSNFLGFVNDYCAQITGLNNLMLGNFWVNINQKYDYNRTHDHQNSILSGVYYVDCEGDDVGNFVAEILKKIKTDVNQHRENVLRVSVILQLSFELFKKSLKASNIP